MDNSVASSGQTSLSARKEVELPLSFKPSEHTVICGKGACLNNRVTFISRINYNLISHLLFREKVL